MMYRLLFALLVSTSLLACDKETRDCPGEIERVITETGFTKIKAGENFTVVIKQGNDFSIKAKGCANDVSDLLVSNSQGILEFRYKAFKNGRNKVSIEITMPSATSIILAGVAQGRITGFAQQQTHMIVALSGATTCTVDDLPVLLKADLSGTSELTLHGTTPDLIARVTGNSRLHAYTATVTDIDVSADGTSKAYVKLTDELVALAAGESRIYYKGTPTSVQVELQGNGKVVHE